MRCDHHDCVSSRTPLEYTCSYTVYAWFIAVNAFNRSFLVGSDRPATAQRLLCTHQQEMHKPLAIWELHNQVYTPSVLKNNTHLYTTTLFSAKHSYYNIMCYIPCEEMLHLLSPWSIHSFSHRNRMYMTILQCCWHEGCVFVTSILQ